MSGEALIVAALTAMAATPVVAAVAWWRGRTSALAAVLAVTAAASSTWFVFVWLVAVDYNDADGFSDCLTHCTTWQTTVRWVVLTGPALSLVLAGAALVASWRTSRSAS